MKDIFELSATANTNVEGSSQITQNTLEPVKWLREIMDAAKTEHYFAQFAKQSVVPKNASSVVFPYRTKYIANSDWEADVSENTTVNWTTFDTLDGVEVEPAAHNGGIAISDEAIRRNALDLVRAAKEELTYHSGDLVDLHVRDQLTDDSNQAGAASRGAYTIYGGDARAESELESGDVLTPDMLADAKTNLQSKTLTYWDPGTPADEDISSVTANPWKSSKQQPFVALLGVEQEGSLLKDSQFMNASEYGSNDIIMNGEIGKYAGLKVISTANTRSFTTSSSLDGGSNAGAAGNRCVVMKALTSIGLAWGRKPRLRVFDYPSDLQKRMVLDLAYKASVIHSDAICYIDVTNS